MQNTIETDNVFDAMHVRADAAHIMRLTPEAAKSLAHQLKVAASWSNHDKRNGKPTSEVEVYISEDLMDVTVVTSTDSYVSAGEDMAGFDTIG